MSKLGREDYIWLHNEVFYRFIVIKVNALEFIKTRTITQQWILGSNIYFWKKVGQRFQITNHSNQKYYTVKKAEKIYKFVWIKMQLAKKNNVPTQIYYTGASPEKLLVENPSLSAARLLAHS